MIKLEKIQPPLFSSLYKAFLVDDDPYSGEREWRNVFDYQWDTEEDYCGYAMLDDGDVVGMMGMVFSERLIAGASRKFCNVHTWWVREDHRGRSLAMLRPLIKLEGYTITHFTPCDTIRAVFSKRLGFRTLDSQLKILLRGRRNRATEDPTLTYDEEAIEERLIKHDRKILVDHRPYGCGHLVLSDGDDYCYVLFTHVIRHRMPYCHIQYISNKKLFAEKESVIRSSMLSRYNAKFVAVDARLVREIDLPRSFHFWAPAHGLYKSSDVEPDQIDNLYSDVVFLHLTTLPDISHELKEVARRFWPFGRRSRN